MSKNSKCRSRVKPAAGSTATSVRAKPKRKSAPPDRGGVAGIIAGFARDPRGWLVVLAVVILMLIAFRGGIQVNNTGPVHIMLR